MKKASTSVVSGCIVWVLLIGVLSSCILPVFFVIGSVTSFSDYAIKTTGNILCPTGTTPESYSYQTTTHDSNGFSQPTTAYELHCVDAGGEILKTDPVVYAFLWIGIFVFIGLIVTGVQALILAAPAGVLITKFINRIRKPNPAENIEPQ